MIKPTILITGAGSMLARYLNENLNATCILLGRDDLDISDVELLKKYVRKYNPSVLINTAGSARGSRDELFNINAYYPAQIAAVCRDFKITFVNFSTGRVFSGNGTFGYTESDAPAPIDDYGDSKLTGERFIESESSDNRFFQFRLPLVLGWRVENPEKQVVTSLLKKAKEIGEIRVADDVVHSPVYAGDVAHAVQQCLNSDLEKGIYHLTSDSTVSLFDLMMYLVDSLNIKAKVIPVKDEYFNPDKKIPLFQALKTVKRNPLRNWKDSASLLSDEMKEVGVE